MKTPALPGHSCQVFLASDFYVASGVNLDEGLGEAKDVCPGDVFQLDPLARPRRLLLAREGIAQTVLTGSAAGIAGASITLAARHILMAPNGDRVEVLTLRQSPETALFVLPLSPVAARTQYELVMVEDAPEETRLGDLLCISFARGTMIALGDGRQRAIEALQPGDRILTRDHGPQPLRWKGQATLRAVGAFAPVVITAGTLGNTGDLIVSQHHRMFLYQRRAPGQAELLVQARHLVNENEVFLREGGVVDYFSLIFDSHEIIYAEGIPAESLMVNDAITARLPPELGDEVKARFPGLSQAQHFGAEVDEAALRALGDRLYARGGRKA